MNSKHFSEGGDSGSLVYLLIEDKLIPLGVHVMSIPHEHLSLSVPIWNFSKKDPFHKLSFRVAREEGEEEEDVEDVEEGEGEEEEVE